MRTNLEDFITAVEFKDCVNSFKTSHNLNVEELLQMLKDEVEEFEEAYKNESKQNALLEIADIGVFAALLYNKIKEEKRK